MAVAERRAVVVWEGNLTEGGGRFTVGSGAMGELPVTWASRTERSDGKTSPEELIAAAHASCFAMAVSNVVLDIRGRVPGLDAEGFQTAIEQADQGCPVSNALRGNVDIRVNASLD